MASTHASLDAAAHERKARLAKLKSLKRKQPSDNQEGTELLAQSQDEGTTDLITTILSGRNYDAATRGPKLGFENGPAEDQETLEKRAKEINDDAVKQAEEEEKADNPIDLFRLQPKKPDWDLKRDVERKLARLNVQTDNAIARLVRERIAMQKKKQMESLDTKIVTDANGGDVVGLQGEELVEGIHLREEEEAEDKRRDRDDGDDNDV